VRAIREQHRTLAILLFLLLFATTVQTSVRPLNSTRDLGHEESLQLESSHSLAPGRLPEKKAASPGVSNHCPTQIITSPSDAGGF
jgi:hypothetical protein